MGFVTTLLFLAAGLPGADGPVQVTSVSTLESPEPTASEPQGDDPPAVELRAGNSTPSVALTVWQSAWKDFAEVDRLGEYVRRNGITEIFLNPGLGITPSTEDKAYAFLAPLVTRLRSFGLRRIHLLYAELFYDIGGYAAFLVRHPGLGITSLVDDSEFTDLLRERFERNYRSVSSQGILYSAFVTLERPGNSGVSDATRFWALATLAEPILMSYFACTLEGQQKWLEPYLEHADRLSKKGSVRIALLLGGKKVGREISCEQELEAAEFQQFIAALDALARRHPSYGGLVLESNRRLPGYDIVASASDTTEDGG